MLQRVMVTIIKPPAPSTPDGLPEFPELLVVFCPSEINSVPEQVEVHRKTALVERVRGTVANLLADLPMASRISVRVPERQLITLIVSVSNKLSDHPCKQPLLLPQWHLNTLARFPRLRTTAAQQASAMIRAGK